MNPKEVYYRSSLQRCQQDDIYAAIQNPQRQVQRKTIDPAKDTMSEAEKYERDTVNYLLELAKGGKILFMGMVLPARFLFILFPQLTLKYSLPFAKKMGRLGNTAAKKLLQQLIAMTVKMKVVNDVYSKLMQIASNIVKNMWDQTKNRASNLLQKAVKPLEEASKWLTNKIDSGIKRLQDRANALAAPVVSAMRRMRELMKMAQVKVTLPTLTPPMIPAFNKSLNWLNHQTQQFKKWSHKMSERVHQIAKPIGERITEESERLYKAAKRPVENIVKMITPKIANFKEMVTHNIQKAMLYAKYPVNAVMPHLQQTNQKVLNWMSHASQKILSKARFNSMKKLTEKVKSMTTIVGRSFTRLKHDLVTALKRWSDKRHKYTAIIKKRVRQYQEKAKGIVVGFVRRVAKFKGSFLSFLKKFVRRISLVGIWLRILIKFAGLLMRELFREVQVWAKSQ